VRFYLEEGLEKLARWLRFLGHEAYLIKGPVSFKSVKPDGVFITTSRRWYERLKKAGLECFLVPRHEFKLQLRAVVKHYGLKGELSLERCAFCSSRLEPLTGEELKRLVPPAALKEATDFRRCPSCGAVFWKGSHYERMKKKLREMLNGLD